MSSRKFRWFGLLLAAASFAVLAVVSTRAQERQAIEKAERPTLNVRESLDRPFSFLFAQETTLDEVAEYLKKTLKAQVVIDRAALDRIGIESSETVVLKLDSVRLKVGLKLLLDQLEMTYRIEPEDNLLILTDATGSGDPMDKITSELKSLHRDIHDVQDALEEIMVTLGFDDEGPKMRKPTITEEMPANQDAKPKAAPARPDAKPRHSGF